MTDPEVVERLKDLAVGVVIIASGLGLALIGSVTAGAKIWVHRKSPSLQAPSSEGGPRKEFH